MRSKAPSGGMKLMVRSFSKRARRTHWWNFMSSKSTDLFLPARPWLSNSTCANMRRALHTGLMDSKPHPGGVAPTEPRKGTLTAL